MFVFVKGMKGKEANKMGAALQDIHRLTHHGDILNSQEKLQSFLNSSVRFTTSWREEFISAMKKLLGAFIHLNSCEEIMDDFYPQLLLVARHETYYTVLLRAAHGNSVVPQSMFCLSPEWLAATHSCKCTLQRPTQPFSSDAMSASLSASKNRQSFPDCNSAPLRRPYIDSSMRWNPPRVRPRLPVGMSPRLFSCESSVDRNYHHAHLERVSETPLWQRRAADVGFRGQLPARPSSVLRSSVRSKCSATPTPVNGGRRSQFLRTRSGTTTALTRSASSVRQMDPAASHSGPCIRIGSKLVCGIPLKLQRTATLSPGLVGTVQNSSSKGVTGPQANIYTNANTRGKCTQLVLTPRG
uniref:Uncharacterized protein TCIL3000_11_15300 n=1 Tax=Trypanosoma congolense (strain IL3000) TaxID=1068625 RepID=G0V2Z0_TRYCI|nr:unnamed protein product [Trypanosoma congolense IL3000]